MSDIACGSCPHQKSQHYFGDGLGADMKMHTWCQVTGCGCTDYSLPTTHSSGAARAWAERQSGDVPTPDRPTGPHQPNDLTAPGDIVAPDGSIYMTDRPTGPATAAARAFMLALEDEDVDREALPRTLAAIEAETKARILAALPEALAQGELFVSSTREIEGHKWGDKRLAMAVRLTPEAAAAALAAAIERVLG